jgi:tetratricopeptide (TPR) repeat protein
LNWTGLIKSVITYLSKKSGAFLLSLCFVLVLLLGVVDVALGTEISSSILYLIPVALAAWLLDRRAGMVISLASAYVWFLANYQTKSGLVPFGIMCWNAIVTFGFFATTASLLATIRRNLELEKKLSILDSVSAVATLCLKQGRYSAAEALFMKNLRIKEQALGEQHPEVAKELINLGVLYNAQGRYEEAEALHRRSFTILERAIPEGREFARCLEEYASVLRKTDREAEADRMETRARDIRSKLAQENHVDELVTPNPRL